MNNETIFILAGSLTGLFVGWLFCYMYLQKRHFQREAEYRVLEQENRQLYQENQDIKNIHRQNELEFRQLHSQLAAAQEKLHQQGLWREEYELLNQELRAVREVNSAQEAELREVTIRLEETRLTAEEKQRLLISSEQRLSTQFENLANRIFANSERRLDEHSQMGLDKVLAPLREQLEGFRRQVQEGFGQEARERHTLTHEIRQLQQLNSQMAEEALNLTKALKGDNKILGNWGEVILSRILESSGLREGFEYFPQVSIHTGVDTRMQPDVLIRLPQGKEVVIDAKVSLHAYERYFNCEDEQLQHQYLNEHIASVRQHIRSLGNKDYQRLPGIHSLDYVLMFVPVEPAFLVALDQKPELITEALRNNIMLVSPTTLMVALRTINNLWRYERQSENAQLIADRASRLYDKFRLFIEEMENIGQGLDRAQNSYQQAMKKLAQGRGNLISQAEGFRELGVEIKRSVNSSLIDIAKRSENRDDIGRQNDIASIEPN